MDDGSWDLWEATDSLLERVVQGKTARLEGTGVLELEEQEDAQESGAPRGPGSVRFTLFCDFEQLTSPHAQAIQIHLVSRDDAAFKIIRGQVNPKFQLLPSYRLSGSISAQQGEVPVRMEALAIDAGGLTPLRITDEENEISRLIPVNNVTVGSLEAVMNSIRNGLGMRKTRYCGDRANRRIRIPMRFSPKFITRSSEPKGSN